MDGVLRPFQWGISLKYVSEEAEEGEGRSGVEIYKKEKKGGLGGES